MLEYMRVTIFALDTANYTISFTTENGIVSVFLENAPISRREDKVHPLTKDESICFHDRILDIGIYSWEDKYISTETILDGITWKVKYKEFGLELKTITGDNAFPDNWNEFEKLINDTRGKAFNALLKLNF